MVVIVDFVNFVSVLVDGANFQRTIYPLKRLTLTRMKVPILRGCRTGTLLKATKAYDLETKWAACKSMQKMERFAKRKETTDFDRFKIMVLRKQRSFGVKKLAKKLRK